MLKKLFLASLVCGLCFGGEATEFDGKVTDELKKYFIANNDVINDDLAGEWYLYWFDYQKYSKVENDEFERAEAFKQGKEAFEKLKEQHKNLDTNKTYVIFSKANFGEYDFEKENFPVDFINEKSFFRLNLGKLNSNITDSIVVFDNVDTDKHVLKMPKDEANKFLKSRKDGSFFDRKIEVDLEFTLNKVELGENSHEITERHITPEIKVTGHIKRIILMDQKVVDPKSKKSKVLSVIEYE